MASSDDNRTLPDLIHDIVTISPNIVKQDKEYDAIFKRVIDILWLPGDHKKTQIAAVAECLPADKAYVLKGKLYSRSIKEEGDARGRWILENKGPTHIDLLEDIDNEYKPSEPATFLWERLKAEFHHKGGRFYKWKGVAFLNETMESINGGGDWSTSTAAQRVEVSLTYEKRQRQLDWLKTGHS